MATKANPMNILLIEDNEHDRVAFQRAMKMGDVDCRIAFCKRAEEADDLMKSAGGAFDVVVLDFDLPGMNGLDFFKKMKRKKNLPPFVMLTGAGSEKLVVQALLAGMYDYVVKDAQMGYLNLLPVVLDTVLRRYADDRARREAKAALKKAKDELEQKVRDIALKNSIDADFTKVTEIEEIMKYGILMTPGLVVNEEVKSYGVIPKDEQIINWLKGN